MYYLGLDIVRRDWSQFAADAGKTIIDIIMTDKSEDARLAQIQVSIIISLSCIYVLSQLCLFFICLYLRLPRFFLSYFLLAI